MVQCRVLAEPGVCVGVGVDVGVGADLAVERRWG